MTHQKDKDKDRKDNDRRDNSAAWKIQSQTVQK